MFRFLSSFMTYTVISFILLYQNLMSPFLGRNCRFYPTCSHYAYQAFKKYNFFYALFLVLKRVLKCHPFHEGGEDTLP